MLTSILFTVTTGIVLTRNDFDDFQVPRILSFGAEAPPSHGADNRWGHRYHSRHLPRFTVTQTRRRKTRVRREKGKREGQGQEENFQARQEWCRSRKKAKGKEDTESDSESDDDDTSSTHSRAKEKTAPNQKYPNF